MPHQGNSENIFSMAENRSTCNTQLSMSTLLTTTAANKKLYKPEFPDIWKWYQTKYKGMRVYADGEGSSDSECSDSSDSDSSGDEQVWDVKWEKKKLCKPVSICFALYYFDYWKRNGTFPCMEVNFKRGYYCALSNLYKIYFHAQNCTCTCMKLSPRRIS